MVLPAPVSPVTTVSPGCGSSVASLITPRSAMRSSVIIAAAVTRPDRRSAAPRQPSTRSPNLCTSRSVNGASDSRASRSRWAPRVTSISIPVRSSTDRRPSHQTTPWVWETSIISTTTVDVGLSTSGRANSACALSGTTSIASTPGQTTGPPAENAYAVDPVGVATRTPSQAQRDSGRPSTSTSTSSIRSRDGLLDRHLVDRVRRPDDRAGLAVAQRDLDGEPLLDGVRAVAPRGRRCCRSPTTRPRPGSRRGPGSRPSSGTCRRPAPTRRRAGWCRRRPAPPSARCRRRAGPAWPAGRPRRPAAGRSPAGPRAAGPRRCRPR